MDEQFIEALILMANEDEDAKAAIISDIRTWRDEAFAAIRSQGGESPFISSVASTGKTTGFTHIKGATMTNMEAFKVLTQALASLEDRAATAITYADYSQVYDR